MKKGVLKNFTKFTRKQTSYRRLIDVETTEACNFIKKSIPTQVFSCYTYFEEHLCITASTLTSIYDELPLLARSHSHHRCLTGY